MLVLEWVISRKYSQQRIISVSAFAQSNYGFPCPITESVNTFRMHHPRAAVIEKLPDMNVH